MALINATAIPDAADYELEQSLKFNDDDSHYLQWTPSNAATSSTVWTFSFWSKGHSISDGTSVIFGSIDGSSRDIIRFDGSGGLEFVKGSTTLVRVPTQKFRDVSAWYHFIIAVSGTTVNMYVNGEQITDFSTSNNPSGSWFFGQSGKVQRIGQDAVGGDYADGYLTEVNFIDGQALTPAHFGYSGAYGEWKPIEYSGTYGNNGFYLPFKVDYSVEGFNAIKYKGNSLNDNYIGGIGFKPDITWLAPISVADHKMIYDRVRGSSKQLKTNAAEVEAFTNKLLSTTDGIYLTTTDQNQNSSSHTYVTWNWDMGVDTPTGFACVMTKGNANRRTITDIGFSPDLIINDTLTAHQNTFVYDRIRGPGKELRTNASVAEGTNDGVLSFTKDGFRRGSSNDCNENGTDYVDWCWYMGNTSVTNTDGSLTSTVMASTTYGQSIVKYTGNTASSATVGHGLNYAPEFMIVRTTGANAWAVYHASIGNTHLLEINTTSAKADNNTFWNDTSPTNSVFTIGSHDEVNHTQDYIAYCFHSVSGYSKFGTYSGDGTTNGSKTVNLGFRPAWVMIKCTNDAESWWVWDNVRNPFTNTQRRTALNSAASETTNVSTSADNIQFTSTGFKMTGLGGGSNQNGNTYVYAAFAGGQDSISPFNTDGSSDSRVKANPTYGQSIVTYTGQSGAQTIGHGLSSAPEVIMAKNRSSAQEWLVYHHSLTDAKDKYLRLDSTAAVGDNTFWNDTAPTSSVFSVGDSQPINSGHGNDYVAYCWHSVTGYSKFGSYNGSGSAGNKQTLGFAPAFVLIKKSNGTDNWYIHDNARNPSNPVDKAIRANEALVEDSLSTNYSLTFLSDGFEFLGTGLNASGSEYIYMAFADKREYAYWLDQSGNNNDFTGYNLTESDISVDSPTNNFCTWNPESNSAGGLATLSEGNLRYNPNGTSSASGMFGTIAVDSGKWYFEVYRKTAGNGYHTGIAGYSGTTRKDYHVYAGQYYYGDNDTTMGWASPGADTEIISCAFDLDNNKIWFARNNAWKNNGDPAAGTGQTDTLTAGLTSVSAYTKHGNASYTGDDIHNFGQDSSFAGYRIAQGYQDSNEIGDFYYEPPTGFLALCTKNLPEPAVVPSKHFNTVLYTGDGGSSNAVTGVGFQPDWLWIKNRTNANSHSLVDSVRGESAGALISNSTNAEDSIDRLNLDSDGFTLTGNYGFVNTNTDNYVAWNWKAPTSSNLTASGARSIATTSKVNVDAGFEIITYTGNGTAGAKIGHSLGKAPDMMIAKNRTDVESWWIYQNPTVNEAYKISFDSAGRVSNSTTLNNTAPTSSLITLGNDNRVNASGDNYLIYAFATIDGYSKIGTYTGNGNADGPFVYTGFRPAFVMGKRTNDTEDWFLFDSTRNPTNPVNGLLYPAGNNAEYTGVSDRFDLLSNGFKPTDTDNKTNGGGSTYIYIAFAEVPFKYSNAR